MGKKQSIRSKAVHFVSDLTTVILNPISDKPSKPSNPKSSPSLSEDESTEAKEVSETEPKPKSESSSEEEGEKPEEGFVDGPDTSSFSAFLYSLLASDSNPEERPERENPNPSPDPPPMRENSGGRRSLLSKGKQTLGRAFSHATRIGGFRSNDRKPNPEPRIDDVAVVRVEKIEVAAAEEDGDVPGASEPSLLMSENTRHALYASLPALVQGQKWMLLYSTWRHGISLSTLYRRSMLWPGLSLLVVGDRKGATFGGLIEAPLNPTNKKRYQGSNATFVFTDKPGHPCIFHPTGANRYFTLCSLDFLAIGGGGHFALYLDNDLLNGSSSVSETYGNPCLANSEEFEVKEVELWGFVYPSKYEEILAQSRIETPGICRW